MSHSGHEAVPACSARTTRVVCTGQYRGEGLERLGHACAVTPHLPLSRCTLERESAAHAFETLSSAGERAREPGARAYPGRILDAGRTQGSEKTDKGREGLWRQTASDLGKRPR